MIMLRGWYLSQGCGPPPIGLLLLVEETQATKKTHRTPGGPGLLPGASPSGQERLLLTAQTKGHRKDRCLSCHPSAPAAGPRGRG